MTGMLAEAASASEPVSFQAVTARSGAWSDPRTWERMRVPQTGDRVQVRSDHVVSYDVASGPRLRMVHVAGTLSFSREDSTVLEVGLLRVEPGETTTEDGFDCHAPPTELPPGAPRPALELGTPDRPIPAGVSATIRLRHFPGMNPDTLPAIVCCGGRWDVHGAPLERTWVKLAAPARAGESRIALERPVADWRAGDRIIVTTGQAQGPERGATFRRTGGRPKPVGTEERIIDSVDGAVIRLDRPLERDHPGNGLMRCEVANLSRNVVIESAEPDGVRGHTMYHHGASGGISYAEFRRLGKEGVLGKYAIHFHLVRDSMRGSGVIGASISDSQNRWITIHGTDHLLVRDCVGYRSLGHGYFLEDATEQWNVLDRNLAVQSFGALPLPNQVLPFDLNDGAGFWWANGRNTFTRNVACENDRYGYHFQIAESPEFRPLLRIRKPDGTVARSDVRTIPFLRFDDNESHGEGLFDFRFGDESPGSVRGDRERPFIVRNLRAWESHYVIRPNVHGFLLDGLVVKNAAYGVYHPDYDAHVYRNVTLDNVTAEPLNGGHDDDSFPHGDFTYERLTFSNCRLGRDPLIQLTAIGTKPGMSGHFRDIRIVNSGSVEGNVVDFGGGPRTRRVEHPVHYYFHDAPTPGAVTRVASVRTPAVLSEADFRAVSGWTGVEARAAQVPDVAFPELLAPIDDLPPATLVTRVDREQGRCRVRGVSHDNGEISAVTVNGRPATIVARNAGVVDWTILIDPPADGWIVAASTDESGNNELTPHRLLLPGAH